MVRDVGIIKCTLCNGTGLRIHERCPSCHGLGSIKFDLDKWEYSTGQSYLEIPNCPNCNIELNPIHKILGVQHWKCFYCGYEDIIESTGPNPKDYKIFCNTCKHVFHVKLKENPIGKIISCPRCKNDGVYFPISDPVFNRDGSIFRAFGSFDEDVYAKAF